MNLIWDLEAFGGYISQSLLSLRLPNVHIPYILLCQAERRDFDRHRYSAWQRRI
jgi:hypothetical protein